MNDERTTDSEELVAVEAQCPGCHERRMDYLVSDGDGEVVCQSCGEVYHA